MSRRKPGAPSRPGRPRKLSQVEWESLCRLLDKRAHLRKQLGRLSITALSSNFGVHRETIIRYHAQHKAQKRIQPA